MCGIAGIINPKSNSSPRPGVEALHHRGPHQLQYWSDPLGTALLGHSRLCVIDTGEGGAQPMTHGDDYAIIYNGEIYNYKELRQELSTLGFVFRSQSDTEVVLAAYIIWGEECLHRFDGMFAFAVWNAKVQTLFAARDRFGEKPFYFHYDGETLLFASEIKALWAMGVKKEVNPSMLYNFLSFGYTGNPADPSETFYKGIQKLGAASAIRYSSRTNQLHIEKYWQLSIDVNRSITKEVAIQEFETLFTDSVNKRLRSDVPIGTSLSGGLDSSSIAAMAHSQQQGSYAHHAFTATFPGDAKDESMLASLVAKKFGMRHTLVPVTGENLVAQMELMMRVQDEPFSSASVMAQYAVFAAAAREGMTVMLDGQGADETLAGYHQYYRWWWRELYSSSRSGSREARDRARELDVMEKFDWRDKLSATLPQFTGALWQTGKSRTASRHPDLHPDFPANGHRDSYYSLPTHTSLNGILFHHTAVNGLEELLRLADRSSMAHGIEVRLPFLSHQLVEYLFSLPPELKIRDGWTKWLLRKTMEDKLPSEIVWRRDKTGFEPPQKKWMQQPEVQQAIREAKQQLVKAGILNSKAAEKMIQPHSAYAADQRDWKYWSASFLFA